MSFLGYSYCVSFPSFFFLDNAILSHSLRAVSDFVVAGWRWRLQRAAPGVLRWLLRAALAWSVRGGCAVGRALRHTPGDLAGLGTASDRCRGRRALRDEGRGTPFERCFFNSPTPGAHRIAARDGFDIRSCARFVRGDSDAFLLANDAT